MEGCAGPTGAKSRRPNTGSCDQGELSGRRETSQLNVNKKELTVWRDVQGLQEQKAGGLTQAVAIRESSLEDRRHRN